MGAQALKLLEGRGSGIPRFPLPLSPLFSLVRCASSATLHTGSISVQRPRPGTPIEPMSRTGEHRMVRHEAAEALGAIGGPKVEEILQLYLTDDERVVTESCEVALDAMDYWTTFSSSS